MKRRLLLVALLAACVPTEPEKDPRGGVAVTFAPSEATAGAPFQSPDGWTVTIEKTAIRPMPVATPASVPEFYGGGTSYARIVDPRYECEVRVTQMSPGPVSVSVQFQPVDPRWNPEEEVEACAVDEATARRFRTFADDTPVTPDLFTNDPEQYQYVASYAPTVYVKGAAVKDGRVLAFDLALAVTTVSTAYSKAGAYDEDGNYQPQPPAPDTVVNVVANQGTPVRFEVHYESMFAGGIDPLAAADADHDGRVTAAELRAVVLACDSTNSGSSSSGSVDGIDEYDPYLPRPYTPSDLTPQCRTLLDQLVLQASTIMGTKPSRR